jgi:hypothetical protein
MGHAEKLDAADRLSAIVAATTTPGLEVVIG